MSSIGYYRLKITPTSSQDVYVYINGNKTKVGSVIVKNFCDNFRLIKYLDRNGKFRFYPFNQFWQQIDKPKQIGSLGKLVTSIYDSQSDIRNIGYNNVRTLSLVAENVQQSELEFLSDLFSSPLVYLQVGETDLTKDWVQVTITGDGVERIRKGNTKKLTIEVTLPKQYTQTLL